MRERRRTDQVELRKKERDQQAMKRRNVSEGIHVVLALYLRVHMCNQDLNYHLAIPSFIE